ncbi:M35 family metallo-endopeptidase [Cognatilysobacter lacus]|uniref:Protease n=1 Tax=Cognatilysobacter lacus TaxID=1643323 RepID=A0A5D8Z5B7_9GAMM|nr:M35 family metallo-endopeptidase [Lysobacter lacus]TZF90185.1 protease [Lysobacter lacus]
MNRMTLLAAAGILLAGAALNAADASIQTARFNPLRVALVASSSQSSFLGAVDVEITNTGNRMLRIPAWQLPAEYLQSDLFTVTRDGREVAYEGPMIKRGLPQAADFVLLRPGQTYRTSVDLSAFYDLAKTGEYTVAFKTPLQHASLEGGQMLMTPNGLPMVAQSAALKLWVDGTDQLGGTQTLAARSKPSSGGTVVNGVSFKSCSTTQINTAGNAVNAARTYSENAKGYLNGGAVGARYTTWFGAYTSTRYSTARQHFVSIDSAIDQSGGQVTINCGCNHSYYAYVYPTRPYEIFVCKAFWSAPLTGTDSKGGTLIHEMSHFNVTAGTSDHVYGQSAATNLAASNPDQALDNADNHEYFAENNPAQN